MISTIALIALIQEEFSLKIVFALMVTMMKESDHALLALKNVKLVIMVQIVLLATPTQDDYQLQIVTV
jgi:hypothetical protein